MPDNKNQHYVPRCHLKPFTRNGEGLAINLLNHGSGRVVLGAPVKNQCSRSYFYGEDLVLEKLLQGEEGKYAAIVRDVIAGAAIDEAQRRLLRDFAYLQVSRTAAAMERRRAALVDMDRVSHQGFEDIRKDEADTSHRRVMLSVMKTWAETARHIHDLDVLLVRNETARDFFTSDDPAALTNRVYLQRMKDHSFGLISVGTQVVMPITPRVAMMSFDPKAYAPKGASKGWIVADRMVDIDAINEFQLLNSVANLYFSDPDDADRLRLAFEEAEPRRPADRFRHWVGIQIEDEGIYERYRRATPEELQTRATRITSHSPVYPVPSRWFSKLPFRLPLSGATNGSGVGFVRSAHMKSGAGFRIEPIPTRPLPGHVADGPNVAYLRKEVAREPARRSMRVADLNALIRSAGRHLR
ncbi:DUF4238 domain-containing protein [Sphingomonas sp. IC-56]|uniref:DUF4238 domain-containing protein n=1 Tax=Sphingomonas sp. IC-56 TaxID=2898529 RepID=UPI001E335993|nr:DUF4238 domain-containing protein [Sphingomonas sp. IC-56]MCD2323047.1 DUF4238 domain-containing protein [Sphingomonas sp. IC-56]